MSIKPLLHQAKSWLWPQHCVLCKVKINREQPICIACYQELPWLGDGCKQCSLPLASVEDACGRCIAQKPKFDSVTAPWKYHEPCRQFVLDLKFNKRLDYAKIMTKELGVLLNARYEIEGQPTPQALIPVPLHKTRLRFRGFNQSAMIASLLSRQLSIPVEDERVVRVKATQPQLGMKAHERKRNMKKAFSVKSVGALEHVALVDDVVTTGSTVAEIARLLKKEGVKRVDVYALCRAV